jgi:DNA-binding IclR family transcriptional regulator
MLLAFTQERPRPNVNELARAAGVPTSTAYRHLSLLREIGLVAEDGRGAYHLTPLVHQLGRAARAAHTLFDITRPIMERVRSLSGETVLIYRRVGDQAVCLELLESADPIRLSSQAGAVIPLHSGAGAKVLLAHMSGKERDDFIKRHVTRQRGVSARAFGRELDEIVRSGLATSSAEISPDVWAVAAPIADSRGISHSLTVAGPAFRLAVADRARVAELTRKAAAEISLALQQADL